MEVGLRVVRGKDWTWENQDGGEGGVGTVVEVRRHGGTVPPQNTVIVVWDTGAKANYRVGHEGADDLRVLDNAATGCKHLNMNCVGCNEAGLIGTRWHCERCPTVDLCHACYMGGKHDLSHTFTRWDTAKSVGVSVPVRSKSRKVQANGIYLGATVVLRTNWNNKKQDGGTDEHGVVQSIGGSCEGISQRSIVKVKWDSGSVDDYRRGHAGVMDVKCVKMAAGESYYVDHLACLADYARSVTGHGDRVKLDENQVMAAYKDRLAECLRNTKVFVMDSHGRVRGTVKESKPEGLQQVQTSDATDDNDKDENDDRSGGKAEPKSVAADAFARFAQVRSVFDKTGSKTFTPGNLVQLAAEGNVDAVRSIVNCYPSQIDIKYKGITALQMAALQKHLQVVNVLTHAGASLSMKDKIGNNALHYATIGGEPKILDLLVKYKKNLVNSRNNMKMTCVHYAVIKQFPECLEVLIKNNADVNLEDEDVETALHFAVAKPNTEIQRLLINHPSTDFYLMNRKGNNVIHMATSKNSIDALKMLVEKAPTLINSTNARGLTALHIAVINGNKNAADVLISMGKANINLNVSGFYGPPIMTIEKSAISMLERLIGPGRRGEMTVLQLAGRIGQINAGDILNFFLPMKKSNDAGEALAPAKVKAKKNQKDRKFYTPLQLAIEESHFSIIEFLVSKGADIDAQGRDGDTALHLAARLLKQDTAFHIAKVFRQVKKPQGIDDAPVIAKIYAEIPAPSQKYGGSWIAICCFLVRNGAQLDMRNKAGLSPENLIGDKKILEIIKTGQ